MNIPEDTIADAAPDYFVFAYDEGSAAEIHAAKNSLDQKGNDHYLVLTRSALMRGFHRPTAGEFRHSFITACRDYLRRKGTI